MVNWRGEQAIELMQYFDSRTKYGKFGSETTIIWLFLSCYVSANIFLWLYYINKCISFETPAPWLGSLLIFDQNFVSVCRGCNKNVLLCIFKNTSGCWGMSFPASKVFTSTKWYWFWYKGFTNNSPGVTWKLCLRNFKSSEIECSILEIKTILFEIQKFKTGNVAATWLCEKLWLRRPEMFANEWQKCEHFLKKLFKKEFRYFKDYF